MDPDMNTEALKAVQCRESDLVTKKETDPNRDVASNRIKVELSGDHSDDCKLDNQEAIELVAKNKCAISGNIGKFQATGAIEQLFFKSENDQITEDMTVLSRIKSEVNDWDEFDAGNKNSFALNVGNAEELAVNMDSEVKEELIVESEKGKNPYIITETDLKRIKKECSENYSDEYAAHDFQIAAVEPETDMDSGEYKVTEITEECNIKTDSETSMDAVEDIASNRMPKSKLRRNQQVVTKKTGRLTKCKRALENRVNRKHPNLPAPASKKLFSCANCDYRATKELLAIHMSTHSDSLSNNKCDEYIVKKHPDFFTRKLYECPECIYKATTKRTLKRHMEEEHSEIASSHELSSCVHCGASFKSKMSLDDHILKKHPDFISFVSRKIHQCTMCFYKTVVKSTFDNHMSTHPEATPRYELSRCVHCNATFKRKESLEDHVLKKHPEFFTSGTKKVHECTNCTYKTLIKYHLDKHIASIHHLELRLCVHCGTTFKTKTSLDDHIVKIHPDYITTVTSKLHECSKCTYKTTIKQDYNKHILVHPETASCFDVFRCPHCEVTFRRKESLDDHVLKNHPDFFTSHTKKVYECSECSFRTTMKKNFYRHMSSLVHRKTK